MASLQVVKVQICQTYQIISTLRIFIRMYIIKNKTLLEWLKGSPLQLSLLSVLGKAEWLSWCLGRGRLKSEAEAMTNPLQKETTRTSKCMLTGVIINREVDNE